MTVPMAIVDYIPVGLFVVAAIRLQRDLYNKMSKGAFALFSAGTLMIMIAGLFKATWKLLYAMNVCDFVALNEVFLPMQATGFLLAGVALVALLVARQGGLHNLRGCRRSAPLHQRSDLYRAHGARHVRHLRKPCCYRCADEAAGSGSALCGRVSVHAGDGIPFLPRLHAGIDELDCARYKYRWTRDVAAWRTNAAPRRPCQAGQHSGPEESIAQATDRPTGRSFWFSP